MAANIQINTSPPAVALVGEGLKYEIERTNLPATGYADIVLDFPTAWGAYLNKYFEINTKGGLLKFYFKTTPDQGGLQIETFVEGTGYAVFLAQVRDDIALNYLLNKYYEVYTEETVGIKLVARDIGTAYNLTFVGSDVANLEEESNTAGIDDSTPSDYEIYVGVLLRDEVVEHMNVPIGEDQLNTNSDNKAFADVSEYLKDLLKAAFTYPYNGQLVNKVQNAVLEYYIHYAEYQDNDVQLMHNTFNKLRYAIAGKLKQIDSDYLTDEGTDYFSYDDTRFLTWAPLEKVTYPEAPERLFFLTRQTGLKLMMKAYYSVLAVSTEILEIDQDPYTIIEILCGVPELFIGANVSDLQKYEIWIEDDKGDPVSETRTFIVDHSSYLNIRTLIFKNSLGMYDMLHCTGDLTISDNVKRDEMEVLTNDAFRRKVQLAENSAPYTLNSGHLNDKASRLWLEEIQLTDEIYLALGDYLLPAIMKTGKVTREKDRNHNYSLNITFEPDYRDEAYSSIVAQLSQISYLDRLINSIYNDYYTLVTNDEGQINSETITKTIYNQLLLQ